MCFIDEVSDEVSRVYYIQRVYILLYNIYIYVYCVSMSFKETMDLVIYPTTQQKTKSSRFNALRAMSGRVTQ